MKHKVAPYTLLVVLAAMSIVFTVHAQEATTSASPSATTTTTVTPKISPSTSPGRGTTIKQTLQDIKTDFQQRKEAFRAALLKIKDEHKRTIVDNIDTKISNLNALRTTRLTDALKKMDDIQIKLESRVATAKQGGQDTSSAEAALLAATSAIATAEQAVASQSAKTYTITITDDTTLKVNVGQTISLLEHDLQSVNKMVIDAKQALQKAILAVYQLKTTK